MYYLTADQTVDELTDVQIQMLDSNELTLELIDAEIKALAETEAVYTASMIADILHNYVWMFEIDGFEQIAADELFLSGEEQELLQLLLSRRY